MLLMRRASPVRSRASLLVRQAFAEFLGSAGLSPGHVDQMTLSLKADVLRIKASVPSSAPPPT